MLLNHLELGLLFRLHRTLMFFVNQRLQAIPDKPATPEAFSALPPATRLKVRDALVAHPDLIQAFVEENPAHLPNEELAIVRSWRHLVAGKFYLFRELTKYTVFLSTQEPVIAYGVMALSQPFEELVGPYLPVLVQTVLLPFKDKIVYDGLLTSYNISFGPGIRRSIKESFLEAKVRYGFVTSLPMSGEPLPPRVPKTKPGPKPQQKKKTAAVLQEILGLVEPFCREHLNEEYADLCRKLAEKLARKRPSPLLSGHPNTWASGIVRTIGWVNFLHDKTQTPHMRLSDIDAHFGISESSGAAKLAAIRKMLKINPLDPNWCLPSRLDDNPLVWMLNVNGFLMDIRTAPRESQVVAFEKGLIPYIPADRQRQE
jgi:hypothetical protein